MDIKDKATVILICYFICLIIYMITIGFSYDSNTSNISISYHATIVFFLFIIWIVFIKGIKSELPKIIKIGFIFQSFFIFCLFSLNFFGRSYFLSIKYRDLIPYLFFYSYMIENKLPDAHIIVSELFSMKLSMLNSFNNIFTIQILIGIIIESFGIIMFYLVRDAKTKILKKELGK